MSKKTFMRIDWREILVLLLIDIFVFYLFAMWMVAKYVPPEIDQKYALIVFFANFQIQNFQNLVPLFAVVLVVNFALSALWHFAVKR